MSDVSKRPLGSKELLDIVLSFCSDLGRERWSQNNRHPIQNSLQFDRSSSTRSKETKSCKASINSCSATIVRSSSKKKNWPREKKTKEKATPVVLRRDDKKRDNHQWVSKSSFTWRNKWSLRHEQSKRGPPPSRDRRRSPSQYFPWALRHGQQEQVLPGKRKDGKYDPLSTHHYR